MCKKKILLGVLSLSLLASNTIVPLSIVTAAEIEPSRSLVTNSTSILEKINDNYAPTSVLEKGSNTVEENYIISSEDLAALNAQLFQSQPGKFSTMYIGGDYPKNTVRVFAGNINLSTVSALAAFLVTKGNLKYAAAIEVANIVFGTNLPSVYYTVYQTTWRTNGITYVEVKTTVWKYSNYTGYIGQGTSLRTYSDNGMD
ncbi:hypothetical protein [Trichococcus shcherbakoviae]|uniref:Uncharacterized protein n=1 Tax=Trichococcus shcherbakoviae subsp. psychrophilus TaxID=2585775 RepID=A0A5C5E524_9LACT|nr:hypothetical protein [Trichococcus shcherbakoviae]TNV68091.1 hypothetical protein FHK04_13020 [Trichococcus shcherbakoviae subsp. psychrophilus]